jgi:hypothetical protein
MLLGLQPARYVVLPQYAEKLKQLLALTNDMEGGLPLEYDVLTLQVCLPHPALPSFLQNSSCRFSGTSALH